LITASQALKFLDHEAYAGTRYGNNDEISIEVKNQDIYTLPCESLLYIEGILLGSDNKAAKSTKLVENFVAHLFSEVRYKINDVEIDHTRNVGIASTVKGLTGFSSDQIRLLSNSGWSSNKSSSLLYTEDGSYNAVLPLSTLMGFFEDCSKVLMNCKQELILLRSQNDSNAVTATTNGAGE
jgi:hypothetical protein